MSEQKEVAPVKEENMEEEPLTEEENLAAEESDLSAPEETEESGKEEIAHLKQQLEDALQEAAQNKEGWQRAAAEMANFKRRQNEQMKLARDRIKSEVLEGVISALDDLDLAFHNIPDDLDGQLIGWVEGFRLVQRKLDKILEDQNVKPIKGTGEFDPNFHEAVSYEDNEELEEGQIIAELRKGYKIGNRVLRPSLVRVAK